MEFHLVYFVQITFSLRICKQNYEKKTCALLQSISIHFIDLDTRRIRGCTTWSKPSRTVCTNSMLNFVHWYLYIQNCSEGPFKKCFSYLSTLYVIVDVYAKLLEKILGFSL